MPADSIPAAHSAPTEMSAHPVSKSSFNRESTRSHVHPKEAQIRIRLEPANVRMGQIRTFGSVGFTSHFALKADIAGVL
jgi:hypothetical protein